MRFRYCATLIVSFLISGCLKTRAEVSQSQNYQSNQTQVAQMQKASSFDSNSRLGEVEESLRVLMGKIEEIEYRVKNVEVNSNKSQSVDQDPIVQDLQRKLGLALEELKSQKEEIADLKATQLAAQSSKVNVPSAKDSWSQAEELFDNKDYRRAILSYQKYREQNPKGSKFAEATYKIGFCFEKLSMNDEAKSFYSEVIDKYPKTTEAQKAKVRVKKLK